MIESQVIWRRVDCPGHEAAMLLRRSSGWSLHGSTVFLADEGVCSLHYDVACDSQWCTTSAKVWGWIGATNVELDIIADESRRWKLNGETIDGVLGCTDIDLNFSPATNLLPMRRLALPIGAAAEVHAAWLRFPNLQLERLDQKYTRIGDRRYSYESGSDFRSVLTVNEVGFVREYAGLWIQE